MTSQVITSPIADDLAKLPGVSQGFRPSTVNRSRFVFLSKPGMGKSTLIHSNPKAFVLDGERGGNTVDDPQAICFTPDPDTTPEGKSAAAYLKTVDTLIARRKKGCTDIDMLVLDTYDELIGIFMEDLLTEHDTKAPLQCKTDEGNAYTTVKMDIFRMLDRVYRAGFGWCVLAHVKPVTDKQGNVSQSLAVSDSYRDILKRKCEHMMFIKAKTKVTKVLDPPKVDTKGRKVRPTYTTVKKTIRVLMTQPGTVWENETTAEVKVRVPFPDSIEIPRLGGWQVVTDAYTEAIKTLTQGDVSCPTK